MRSNVTVLAGGCVLVSALLLACQGRGADPAGRANANASASASAGAGGDADASAAVDAGEDPARDGPRCVEAFDCGMDGCADYAPEATRSTCEAGTLAACEFSVDGQCGDYVIRVTGNWWHWTVLYWARESGQLVARNEGTDFLAYCENQHASVFSGEIDAYTTCYDTVDGAIECGRKAGPCDAFTR